ncbi:flavin reductase family protein [Streptomyces sp. MP131-18]|uniref:flavin reductase family protein n=1 Tax=Streptomyces sp. MP131-18 TaxID=1857892 RepID=UPI00097C7F51|nr:flavin reductase family protein [Streptomyces sp. MP131-18]ONK10489.1 Flavin-dependent monooxygenase, reductase subunit HsaB [Streptomyces sp. MP131-18]
MIGGSLLDTLLTSCVVVTSRDGDEPRGCLVGSVMPVGYDAGVVAFALTAGSRTERAVAGSGVAALHVLAADDLATARVFAADVDRFGTVPWSPGVLGAPVLGGVAGVLEMAVTASCAAGGCRVFCGEVRHATSTGTPGRVLTITEIRERGVESSRTSMGEGT